MVATVLRTPDHRFTDLPGYPFAPNYLTVGGLRMHYVDEGPRDAPTVFLFHGQPSWSYLYRHMIPPLVAAGYRAIAPDLIGFGRSDKPARPGAHSFQAHVDWMEGFVHQLGVTDAAAFFQDWGGMIGLRVLANNPGWLRRLVVANTALADPGGLGRLLMPLAVRVTAALAGRPTLADLERTRGFREWLGYFLRAPDLEVGRVIQAFTTRTLSPAEVAAYDAPFPDARYASGPRRMPAIVATDMAASHRAWGALEQWPHPVLTLFSDSDPFLAGTPFAQMFRDRLPGAAGQPHQTTAGASHFLQEDQAAVLVANITAWLSDTGFTAEEQA